MKFYIDGPDLLVVEVWKSGDVCVRRFFHVYEDFKSKLEKRPSGWSCSGSMVPEFVELDMTQIDQTTAMILFPAPFAAGAI